MTFQTLSDELSQVAIALEEMSWDMDHLPSWAKKIELLADRLNEIDDKLYQLAKECGAWSEKKKDGKN